MRKFRRGLRRLRRRATFLAMRQLMRATGFASARRIGRLLAGIQFRMSWRVRRRCARDLALLLGRPPGDHR
jgi:KDO2-lipid IV(A) lauroyltransferase